jgi:ABC-type phosphate/phosphonate transport system ATPase subunit
MKKPLLITIGPQCAGKTTYLRNVEGAIDICNDDQKGTYELVEVKHILHIIKNSR